jgi:hypothetical protein
MFSPEFMAKEYRDIVNDNAEYAAMKVYDVYSGESKDGVLQLRKNVAAHMVRYGVKISAGITNMIMLDGLLSGRGTREELKQGVREVLSKLIDETKSGEQGYQEALEMAKLLGVDEEVIAAVRSLHNAAGTLE